ARALAAAWPGGVRPAASPAPPRRAGPVLALAGSLSPVSRAQVARAEGFVRHAADPARLADDGGALAGLAERIAAGLAAGQDVLVETALPDGAALPPAAAARVTARLGAAILARTVPGLLAIAGGDTSSHAVQALDLWALAHAGSAAPGVAHCLARSDDPRLDGLSIVLKGGQMGPPDLFARLRTDRLPDIPAA
ncbi:MAG: four-carbon acid sugar kinase family protein, partial [Rhodospirillales bacterium]|nr:four-carbon acid sugar kinase family protein [Rhodospirillales bacterium]